ncbi:MAG: GGDEF domain-containing protein [bacterium]
MFSRIRNKLIEYKEIKYLAYHDALTGLLNRNWLFKNLHLIDKKYVYFIDINNLGEVNKLGHSFGDDYIIKCVKSIKVQPEDYLVRYAGDEFLLFTNDKNALITNKFFSVGKSRIFSSIKEAINNADYDMLKAKNKFKLKY